METSITYISLKLKVDGVFPPDFLHSNTLPSLRMQLHLHPSHHFFIHKEEAGSCIFLQHRNLKGRPPYSGRH